MAKISKTFSIDSKIYEKFEDICKSKRINKSKIIQDNIKKFIGENYDVDFTTNYKLKFGENSEIVKINKKENEFILLSNGNKINIFDFEILYKEEDQGVQQVLKDLQSADAVEIDETMSPDILDKPLIDSERAEKLKESFFNKEFEYKKIDLTQTNNIDDDVFIKDNRTTDDKKQDLLEKWRSEETERRKIIEENSISIKSSSNFPDFKPIEKNIFDKKDIGKRKTQRKNQLIQLGPDNIKETLEYIFNTNIELNIVDLVSGKTGETRKFYTIKIDKKYHNLIELKSILSNIGENNYELIHLKEKNLMEKLRERCDNLWNDNFTKTINMINNKQKHIETTLSDLLKGLIRIDEKIEVKYDNPLYTIRLPKNIIENSEYLYFFISKVYNIESDKIIMQPSEVVLEK